MARSVAAASAQIVVIEPTGSETQVVLRAGGVDISVVCRERVTARPGDILHLKMPAGKVHVFDEATGKRLDLE